MFTIYKKIPEILVGNFRSVRTVRVVYHLPKISGLSRRARLDSSYSMKLVRNSRNLFPFGTSQSGKRDYLYRMSREFSSGTNQKIVYHLHPKRNLWEMVNNRSFPFLASCARVLKFLPSPLTQANRGEAVIRGVVIIRGYTVTPLPANCLFWFPNKIPSNEDDDCNENVKEEIFFPLSPNREPAHRLAFLYISLPSLHDFDVKVPNFTFFGGRGTRQRLSFSFPELRYSLLVFTPTRFADISRIKRDPFSVIIKRRFRSRHRSCWVSSHLTAIGKTKHSR